MDFERTHVANDPIGNVGLKQLERMKRLGMDAEPHGVKSGRSHALRGVGERHCL
jgi:hypothetical protein